MYRLWCESYSANCGICSPQNLLRLSLGAVGAGVSPEAVPPQSHSLPSSVSDALEAMGMEDLHLEDLDPTVLRDDPQEVSRLIQ